MAIRKGVGDFERLSLCRSLFEQRWQAHRSQTSQVMPSLFSAIHILLMGIYASISKSEAAAAAATFMQQWVAQRIFRSDALPDGIFGLLGELC